MVLDDSRKHLYNIGQTCSSHNRAHPHKAAPRTPTLGEDALRDDQPISSRLQSRLKDPRRPANRSVKEDIANRNSQTAVMVSMQSTKGSEVMYLESEYEYSFHN